MQTRAGCVLFPRHWWRLKGAREYPRDVVKVHRAFQWAYRISLNSAVRQMTLDSDRASPWYPKSQQRHRSYLDAVDLAHFADTLDQ